MLQCLILSHPEAAPSWSHRENDICKTCVCFKFAVGELLLCVFRKFYRLLVELATPIWLQSNGACPDHSPGTQGGYISSQVEKLSPFTVS